MSEREKTGTSFWRLKRKVMAAHYGHMLLLIGLFAGGAYWIIWSHIQKEKPQVLNANAQVVATMVGKEIQDLGLIVEKMIASDAVTYYKTSYDLKVLQRHLKQFAEIFPSISYFHPDGREEFRFVNGCPEERYSGAPDKRFLPQDGIEPNRIHLFTSKRVSELGESVVEIAYRHVDYFDESRGSIVARLPIAHLSEAFLSAIDSPDSTVSITDEQGRIVFSTEAIRPAGLSEELKSLLAQTDLRFGRHRLFGKDSFVAKAPIAQLPWTVLVAQSKEIYYADLAGLVLGILTVLVAMSLGSVLLAFYISRVVVRPVLLLNEKISQVSGGSNLKQSVQWSSQDEFGLLADSFNKMLARLHDAHDKMAQSQQRVSYLAFHDSLTELPNRASLMQSLERALAQARRDEGKLAVLFIDLDRFKKVNDSLGHQVGDRLLRKVAFRLKGCLRESDTLARLGGDEFVILVQDFDHLRDLGIIAQKILGNLPKPMSVNEDFLYPSASIGIAVFPDDGETGADLVQSADVAMYRAKEQGRNRYQFYKPEMNARAYEQLQLEGCLRQALEEQQFILHYQPQIDLATGRIIAMEALLRWQHPSRGMVAPNDFIPLAEETGLIVPLGAWVLREACRQARAWHQQGLPPVRVAVNLAMRQLADDGLVSLITETLEQTGLVPEFLELELTETDVMQEAEEMSHKLRRLKELGVYLALDDFGTGYSSLSYLKRFAFDCLKIDRSFVQDITTDTEDTAIVQTIIAVARNLGMTVLAEGVETVEALTCLRHMGCQQVQGYLLSRPMPPGQVEQLLRSCIDGKFPLEFPFQGEDSCAPLCRLS